MANRCDPNTSFMKRILEETKYKANIKKYLPPDEYDFFKNYKRIPPAMNRKEFNRMMENSEESSFNDDGIPASEDELFSSSWDEAEADKYVPPITNKKETLIFRIMATEMKQEAVDKELRAEAIMEFKNDLQKKRATKAFKRLRKVQALNLDDREEEATMLRKLELADKKLNRGYYYERCEPRAYKRLLKKRRKAIKRKYQLYALDDDYLKELVTRTVACVQHVLSDDDCTYEKALETTQKGEMKQEPVCPQEPACPQEPVSNPQSCPDDESSMYDDRIPESEREYFTSDFEEDAEPYPRRNSKRVDKYKELLSLCQPLPQDNDQVLQRKQAMKCSVERVFTKFLDRRKAFKALQRYRAVEEMKLPLEEEVQELILMEIADKKLNKPYYYEENEPAKYKRLLAKRQVAIMEKYLRKYTDDSCHRKSVRVKAYLQYLNSEPVPLYEDLKGQPKDAYYAADESSLNDTDIPSSEKEFLSDSPIVYPNFFRKPVTRSKAALYQRLERFEADFNDTEQIMKQKRQARLEAIQDFKERQIIRRREKAAARLQKVNQMSAQDPESRAMNLEKLELKDKKLDKPYYYGPNEPCAYTQLLQKRRRAIQRKYKAYITDDNFADQMEERIIAEADQDPEMWDISDDNQMRCNVFVPESPARKMLLNATLEGGSERLDDHKIERQRKHACAGIWPRYRDSAPPELFGQTPATARPYDISMIYGAKAVDTPGMRKYVREWMQLKV